MKLLATLLVWTSLGLGAICAVTAYMPPVDLPDDRYLARDTDERDRPYLEITSGAGRVELADGTVRPRFPAGTPLSPDNLADMREAGVRRVRVAEFAFARWSHKWYFLLACAGLIGGGLILRQSGKAAMAASAAAPTSERSAVGALRESRRVVDRLIEDMPVLESDEARLHAIVDRLGEAQQTHLFAFVEAREELLGKLGLSGFAQVMDVFASADRQVNRAWSAAADGVLEEATACLHEARHGLEATEQTLDRLAGARPTA